MANVQFIKQFFELFFATRTLQVDTVLEYRENVLLNAQFAKNRCFLWQVTDAKAGPGVHWQRRKVLPIEKNIAAVRCDQANDHVKGCGFAGAVGAEEPNNFAAFNFEGDSFDDFAEFVALRDVLNTQNTHEPSSSASLPASPSLPPSASLPDSISSGFSSSRGV